KASFQTAADNPVDPQDWLDSATKVRGSWWEDYVGWLAARSGPERNRPRRLGSAAYPPLCDAPGTYVHDR
ncbi:MAG TPA: hypothetical protein VFI46_14450, partial [Jiangellaceae bacterium]|nr:hypothetical protein [Jiangellaceae bacterium]